MGKFAVVEKQFEYKGHDCICVFTHYGTRNGYVSVDNYKGDYDAYDIDCHCGLTFGGELPQDYNPKKDNYIGFDCSHICDGQDLSRAVELGLITEKEMEMLFWGSNLGNPVRSLAYVEEQCKKIVDQLESEREEKQTLFEFLRCKTKVKTLCVIRDGGYIISTCWIDYEDLFLVHPTIRDREVKNTKWGTLPIVDDCDKEIKVPCLYIDLE